MVRVVPVGGITEVAVRERLGLRDCESIDERGREEIAAHLVINGVPEINSGWRRWQGVILTIVVHMVGLRIARSITRIMGGLGFLVDGGERRRPLLRDRTRPGEKVSLGAIAGRKVQRGFIWSWDLSGRRERKLMIRIESIVRGGRLGYNGGVEGRAIVREEEGVGKAIRAEA
jgi:hypothetical protein